MRHWNRLPVMLLLLSGTIIAQNVSVGVSGRLLPSFSYSTDQIEMDHQWLFSYGLALRIHLDAPVSFVVGLEGYYGQNNLLEYDPEPTINTPPGTGSLFGARRDIRWVHIQIPLLLRVCSTGPIWIDGGFKLGIGKLTIDDRILVGQRSFGAEGSGTEFSLAPSVEFGFAFLESFSMLAGGEYLCFHPTIETEAPPGNGLVIDPGSNSTIAAVPIRTTWDFHLSGVQFTFMVLYSL